MAPTSNPIVELIQAKDGSPLFRVTEKNGEETTHLLASSYNPIKEAERVLDSSSTQDPQIVFVFGAGNPSLIRLALEKYHDIPIAVMENQPQIRKLFLEWLQENHTSLFQTRKSQLLWGKDCDEDELRKWFKDYSVKEPLYLNNQKQIRIYPKFFSPLKELITKIHNERSTNRSTISKFEKLWLRNITKNTSQIIKSYPLYHCENYGEGLPAVILGAGPSLQENLVELKEHQEQVVIIACDTVLKTLVHWGIQADFVVSIDPQKINSRYLENISIEYLKRTILICEPGIGNQGIRSFPHIMMFDTIFPYYQLLYNFFQPKGEIDIGGTVISASYEIAKIFNFSWITFTGMDFCFQEENYHLQGTMYEEIFFSLLHRYQTFEMFYFQIINNEMIPTLNHLEKLVFIDRKFILFKKWLEKKFTNDKGEIYNSSWGGLSLNGLPHIRLSEFLDKVNLTSSKNKKQAMLKKLFSQIYHFQESRSLNREGKSDFKKIFTQFQSEYHKLIDSIQDYQLILKRCLGYIDKKRTDKIINSQEEIIHSSTAKIAKPFVEIVIQKTLYQTGKEQDQLQALKHLYRELYDACTLNLRYLKRVQFEGNKIYK